MKTIFFKNHFPLNWVKNSLGNLPAHTNLSYFWNFGSFLGMVLVFQVLTGFLLSLNFVGNSMFAFDSVIKLTRESFFGFALRWFHLNGASLFFFGVFLHLFRGLYFCSYRIFLTWMSGVTILLALMMTAFLGYVLPWGQMSLWGATVITNLLSTIPWIGDFLVNWIWGGFSVNSYTLTMFYSLHFILPFVILFLVFFHMMFLHETGSTSKMMLLSNESKSKFSPSFVIKDLMNFSIFFGFVIFVFMSPFKLGDPENFSLANPLSSPLHIQPEWYFLFAYAILRSIPNKLGGVVALVFSIILFYLFPFFSKNKMVLLKTQKKVFFSFIFVNLILTWIGGNPVEPPYVIIGQMFTFLYFFVMFLFLL